MFAVEQLLLDKLVELRSGIDAVFDKLMPPPPS